MWPSLVFQWCVFYKFVNNFFFSLWLRIQAFWWFSDRITHFCVFIASLFDFFSVFWKWTSVINKKWYKLKSVRSQSCLWSIRAQHLKAVQIQLVQFNSFIFSIQKLWIWGNNKNTQLQSVREEKDKNNNQRPTQMSVCLWVWYRLWWSIDRVVSLD